MIANRVQDAREPVRIPPELLRSVPREVTLSWAGKAVAGIAILLVATALLDPWFTLAAKRDAARFKRLEQDSVVTQAGVVNIGPMQGKDGGRSVTYKYSDGGQGYTGRARLRRQEWRALRVGSPLTVRYVLSQPALSWVPGHELRGVPWWLVPIIPAATLTAAFLFARQLRRQHAFLSRGRAALAQVTRCERARKGDHRVIRVHYEFTILSGATRTGHWDVQRNPPAVGSTIVVVYDFDEPEKNARYPLSLVRART